MVPASCERLLDDEVDELEVVARGDLGHDPSETVVGPLRGDHVRADLSRRAYDRCAGVVAARLEREDRHTD